jgi:hypothetical protein
MEVAAKALLQAIASLLFDKTKTETTLLAIYCSASKKAEAKYRLRDCQTQQLSQ